MDQRRDREFARPLPARALSADAAQNAVGSPTSQTASEPTAADRVRALHAVTGNRVVSRLLAPSVDEASPAEAAPEAVIATGGSPLDTTLRTEMEGALGADFSSVRVHSGTEAAASAKALGARAYTVGEDVVVGAGGADRQTMAHELTHVVQQRAGAVDGTPTAGGFAVSSPEDRFEQAAAATASAVVDGRELAGPQEVGPADSGSVTAQLRPADEDEEEQPTAQEPPTPASGAEPQAASQASSTLDASSAGAAQTGEVPAAASTPAQAASASPAQAAGAVRSDLDAAITALSATPPDYKAVSAALSDGVTQASAMRDGVQGDAAKHDEATWIFDTFWIVAEDIGPKAGDAPIMSDVKDAVQLQKAKDRVEGLITKLGGGG